MKTFHIYFYVLSELIRRLKPPSGPVRSGRNEGDSDSLELAHHAAKFVERQHSRSESGLGRLKRLG